MSKDDKAALGKLEKKIRIATVSRILFLIVGIALLFCVYAGPFFLSEQSWYGSFLKYARIFTVCDLIFLLISTFTKLIFTIQYNKTIKQI